MRIITVASSKGGVGKTTVCSALAVRAAKESRRVLIVDLDPQQSLAGWWQRRGAPANPSLYPDPDTMADVLKDIADDGWDWVFVDTPPGQLTVIEDAISHAHLTVIPIKASALDLTASEDAVLYARDDAKVPHLIALNDIEPKWKTSKAAGDYLRKAGLHVAETAITHRAPYVAAMTSGKTGPEVDRTGTAEEEIAGLWKEVKATLSKASRAEKKGGARG